MIDTTVLQINNDLLSCLFYFPYEKIENNVKNNDDLI